MKTEEVKWRIVIDNVFVMMATLGASLIMGMLFIMLIGFISSAVWNLFLYGWHVL